MVTPPGQEPWQLTYTTIPGDAGKGRLYQVSRSALTAGTAVQTVVYRVPLTGTGAPADLSVAQTARWGQTAAPVDATAVFPATQVPGGNPATGQTPTNWDQATVTYMDGNAREVNVRDQSWGVDATWYDTFGNTVQELSAGNRQRALDASGTDTPADEAVLAANLSTITQYSADGQSVTETLGPEHDVALPAGTVRGREHTRLTYDEGAPATGGPYDLVTTSTTSVQYGTGTVTDAATAVTTTQYDWNLREPTAVTVDPTGLALTTRTAYDPDTGQVVSTTLPSGDAAGTTAATRKTVYYRAGTGSGVAACDNRPEWANLVCQVAPAGQPATDPELRTTTTTYDFYGSPAVVTESNSAGVLRTTTTTYDNAGRPVTIAVDAAAGLGTAISTRTMVYDPATGSNTYSRTVDAAGVTTAEIHREFDTLGRLTAYTDADGVRSTTTYDIASRPQVITDGAATQTLTYDGAGQAQQVVDSQGGTSTAGYNTDGAIATENRPGGITVNHWYNEEGTETEIQYYLNGAEVYTDSLGVTAQNRVKWTWSTFMTSGLDYDAAGRLSNVSNHIGGGGCVQRAYDLDQDSNRTKVTFRDPASDGSCQGNTSSGQKQWTYDQADRVTNTGYTYDSLGRTLTSPAGDNAAGSGDTTFSYYVNDMVTTATSGGTQQDYTLDVNADRYRSYQTTTAGVTTTTTNHYASDSDKPTWIAKGSVYTRTIESLGGIAGAYDSATGKTTWDIANLHGDFVATIVSGDAGISATHLTDEFGNLLQGSVGAGRYGWLGAQQRSADNPGGIILMGVRLYNPATGRFLSVDPVAGGGCNAYEYACADPVNNVDLTGTLVRSRYTQVCTRYLCIFLRRTCDTDGHCSMGWQMRFRRNWLQALIYSPWYWTIYIAGWKVYTGSYSHAELGSYNFHGYWYRNGGSSHGRGYFRCWGFTCHFEPGDTLVFEADGTAYLPYVGAVAWTGGATQVPGGGWTAWH